MIDSVTLLPGDCLDVLATLADNSVDSCVTDPPYHLTSIVKRFGAEDAAPAKVGKTGAYARASAGFMGKQWDGGDIAFRPDIWREVYRVLKPGGHLLSFGGTRTSHRMVCAIEDAGFEIRDTIMWLYGSGFPKSHDVSKGIDRAAGIERENKFEASFERRAGPTGNRKCDACGKWLISGSPCQCPRPQDQPITDAAREWQGWHTALKPAAELICLARKPLSESTVAANVLKWETGAINVDGCRVKAGETITTHSRGDAEHFAKRPGERTVAESGRTVPQNRAEFIGNPRDGRWPANIIHDGSEEVVAAFPDATGQLAPVGPKNGAKASVNVYGDYGPREQFNPRNDSGSAARFFYIAKADSDDRLGSKHPTVKPVDLIQYLVRLVTPKGGLCLDPFAGTGTLGEACIREGMRAILIEREAEYQNDIRRRMKLALAGPDERTRETAKARNPNPDLGPLFSNNIK